MIATPANDLQNGCPIRLLADFVAGVQNRKMIDLPIFIIAPTIP